MDQASSGKASARRVPGQAWIRQNCWCRGDKAEIHNWHWVNGSKSGDRSRRSPRTHLLGVMTGLTRMSRFAGNSGDERALHRAMSSTLRHAMTYIWTLPPEGCNRRRSWHKRESGSLRDTLSIFSVQRTHAREVRTWSGGARGGGPRDPRALKDSGGGSCCGGVRSRPLRRGVWCEQHWGLEATSLSAPTRRR